jgi:RNase P protein component
VPARTLGRIQTRAAFGQLQRSRARARCGPGRAPVVPAAPGLPGVFPQVGYTIGKRCGNAVVRNTLRRRARESARAAAPDLPRGTYLLRFDPTAAGCEPAELSRCVGRALRGAAGE